MTACYIDSSFPALLHFAYKYADSPEKAILANANAGRYSSTPFLSFIILISLCISCPCYVFLFLYLYNH